MKVCVGIISVGRVYLEEFEKLFKPSVAAYCQKHGYDLKIFTDFLDPKRRHPDTISFQKCLVPGLLCEYDIVVVLDADIYIHDYSPPIHLLNLDGKIGMVNETGQLDSENYKRLHDVGYTDYGTEYYLKANFQLKTDMILNTGVIVCNPEKHAEYLRNIYEKYVDASIRHPRGFHYEQACIGYEIQKDNMFSLIPSSWNYIYVHAQMLGIQVVGQYFIHFAGLRGSQRETALARHTGKGFLRWGIKK